MIAVAASFALLWVAPAGAGHGMNWGQWTAENYPFGLCMERSKAALLGVGMTTVEQQGNFWFGSSTGPATVNISCHAFTPTTTLVTVVISWAPNADGTNPVPKLLDAVAQLLFPVPGADVSGTDEGNGWKPAGFVSLRSKLGSRFSFDCPARGDTGQPVWGTVEYDIESSICRAAIHYGAITDARGGRVTIEIIKAVPAVASTRNGIETYSHRTPIGSFIFVSRRLGELSKRTGGQQKGTVFKPPPKPGSTTPTPQPGPGCAQWNVAGTWNMLQSGRYRVAWTFSQTGTRISGSGVLPQADADQLGFSGTVGQLVQGSLVGDKLDFVVQWPPRKTDGRVIRGEYTGTVKAGAQAGQGQISDGQTHDVDNPGSSAPWTATGQATCASGATPTPKPTPPTGDPQASSMAISDGGATATVTRDWTKPAFSEVYTGTDGTPNVTAFRIHAGDQLTVKLAVDRPLPAGWSYSFSWDRPSNVITTCGPPQQTCTFSYTVPAAPGGVVTFGTLTGPGVNRQLELTLTYG